MTTAKWEDMFQRVRPYVPDAPELAVQEALKSSAIEFFEKTHTWLYECVTLPASAGISDYELDVPKGTTLVRIHQAWYEGRELTPASEDQLQRMTNHSWPSATGWPAFFTQREPCTILLLPAPTVVQPSISMIDAIIALRPAQDCQGVPYELWDRYVDGISYGARARIHEIPNQSYSDEAQAVKFRRMFVSKVGEARQDRNRGLTRAVLTVQPNRNFV